MFWTDVVKKLRIAGVDSGTYLAGGTLFVLTILLIVALAL
jgi:hypothetical protein